MTSSDRNSSSPCYQFEDNRIRQGVDWLPCGPWDSAGPILSCCKAGDYCMSNGICHYTHTQAGGSGYYQGSCTDSDYNDSLCPHLCNDQEVPDVNYNQAQSEWQCCGVDADGRSSCDDPTTQEYFAAPVPEKLATTASAGQNTLPPSSSSSRPASTASPTSVTSTSASPSATSAAAATAGLSTGATAGIAAGAGILGLVALGALVYFLLRRRKRSKAATAPQELAGDAVQGNDKGGPARGDWQAPAEADSAQVHEMGIPQQKMYYDYAKQQWLYEEPPKPALARQPTEMSADEVYRLGMLQRPAELPAQARPVEMPGSLR